MFLVLVTSCMLPLKSEFASEGDSAKRGRLGHHEREGGRSLQFDCGRKAPHHPQHLR